MKKSITLFSFLTVLGLLLSACGGGAVTTEAPPQTQAPEVTEPPATEPATEVPTAAAEATLKIWADDTRTPIRLEFADDFRAQYNVELIVEDLGRVQDIRTPMITAAPAGEGPDIFVGVHDWLGAMVE